MIVKVLSYDQHETSKWMQVFAITSRSILKPNIFRYTNDRQSIIGNQSIFEKRIAQISEV